MTDGTSITVIRTGKRPAVVDNVSTPRAAFESLGIPSDMYSRWHITTTNGDVALLDTPLAGHATIICGDRVDGA